MNEHYGVEPNAFESASDLHLLLNHFGPYCGRFVAELPSSWREQVRRHIERLPVVEAARAKRRLQLAEQCRSLVPLTKGVQQETQDDWLQLFQAAKRQESELRGPIVARSRNDGYQTVETLDLPLTAEERIPGTVDQYRRVCATLVRINPELNLVDPYLDLCKEWHACVVRSLPKLAISSGNCLFLRMWALLPKQSNVTALQAALDAIVRAVGRPRNGVKLFLLTDGRRDKMHKRYIFGIHGGNELEYGFQHFRDGRPVWVSPMPKAKVTEMLSCFVYRKNDYVLEDTFTG